jgi:hypothetical protein
MRKIMSLLALFSVLLLAAGCSTLGDTVSALTSVGRGTAAVASSAEPIDFRSDEALCSWEATTMLDSEYWVAKILTPASSATKNEAEVVYIEDGTKAWAKWVIPTRKATKADMVLGSMVFAIAGFRKNEDKLTAEEYRKARWYLGRISSVDELFKNRIEVNGESCNWEFIRIPLTPIKE